MLSTRIRHASYVCDEYKSHLAEAFYTECSEARTAYGDALKVYNGNIVHPAVIPLNSFARTANSTGVDLNREISHFLAILPASSTFSPAKRVSLAKIMRKYAAIADIQHKMSYLVSDDEQSKSAFAATISRHAALLAESRTTSPFIDFIKKILDGVTFGYARDYIYKTTGTQTLEQVHATLFARPRSLANSPVSEHRKDKHPLRPRRQL